MYGQIISAIRELAGGAADAVVLGCGFLQSGNRRHHQADPGVAGHVGQDRVKLLKLTWDAVGSEFASRHLQYEMFYAGAQFVTRGHSYRIYDWDSATGLSERLTAKYDLPGT
jgi:4-hydroxyphenylacetate 3-monooxygenase